MSEALLRPATIADLPSIRDLAATIWHAYYPGIVTREQIDYMLARMYALATLRYEMIVQGIRFDRLLLDHAFVGFVAYGPTDLADTWKLHKLYLLPAHHRRGLGSQMLRHCEARAREGGACHLKLNVNKRNARAIAAYERNGYAVVESVSVDIGDGFLMDDFIMAKSLA